MAKKTKTVPNLTERVYIRIDAPALARFRAAARAARLPLSMWIRHACEMEHHREASK